HDSYGARGHRPACGPRGPAPQARPGAPHRPHPAAHHRRRPRHSARAAAGAATGRRTIVSLRPLVTLVLARLPSQPPIRAQALDYAHLERAFRVATAVPTASVPTPSLAPIPEKDTESVLMDPVKTRQWH